MSLAASYQATPPWAHFGHFRTAFQRLGLPQANYTDALSPVWPKLG